MFKRMYTHRLKAKNNNNNNKYALHIHVRPKTMHIPRAESDGKVIERVK